MIDSDGVIGDDAYLMTGSLGSLCSSFRLQFLQV